MNDTKLEIKSAIPDMRKYASVTLIVLLACQLLYFIVMIEEPLAYIFVCLLIGGVMGLAIYLLPDLDSSSLASGGMNAWVCNALPYLIIGIAIFKIGSRTGIYTTAFSDGLVVARKILDNHHQDYLSGVSLINVFLTPLWINLLVLRRFLSKKHQVAVSLAIAVVPFIAALDLLLLGARVTLAYQMVILFIAGFFTMRTALIVSVSFMAAFLFIYHTRAPALYELGAEYLSLTASGRTLGGIHNLSYSGLPNAWVDIAIFFQYLAHSIGELINLSKVMPLFEPNLVILSDQLAILNLGNRDLTQQMMTITNPGNGAYQTFFGPFLVDLGLTGYVVAFIAISCWVIIANIAKDKVQSVLVLILASNFALAPVENFFVMGAGAINFIISIVIAVLL